MKVSLNWIKEFVDIKIKPEKLAHKIALSSVEVDEVINFGKIFKGVFVGEIKGISKHPNADNLSVAKVSFGQKRRQIVFGGGLSLKVGQKLPFALAPVTLPTGMVVEKRSLRGVESQGMIASNKELGIDYNGDDITFFDSKMKVGTPVAKALNLDDIILDLDVLSNRPDLFSHIGVAREIAAITGQKIRHPELKEPKEDKDKISTYLDIEVKDKKLCPRYEARMLRNVKIGPSPAWVKNRLIALGIRPVNNIVDVTNYVMMELGQPLHAFDADTLSGGKKKKIIVRRAKSGEEIKTLDDKKRRLAKDVLLITDPKKPIAVGGVMGGKDTEVSSSTKNIILESANFDWVSIRKASRILGLRSEAVTRMEKGLDPNMTTHALDRAADLMSQVAGGRVLSGRIDINSFKEKEKIFKLSLENISKTLGKKFSNIKITKALKSLGMEVKVSDKDLEVKVPSFRRDINQAVDIIEEVARMIGFDNIPITTPVGEIKPPKDNEEIEFAYKMKDALVGMGFTEVYSYTFVGEDLIKKFGDNITGHFSLKNPLKPEHTYLRSNLIYSMIDVASHNAKNFADFSLFEVAKVFKKTKSKMPEEEKRLCLANYSGNSFFDLKGSIESLIKYLCVSDLVFAPSVRVNSYLHPKKCVDLMLGDKKVGLLATIHPDIANKFDLNGKLTVVELDLVSLMKARREIIYKKYSKFPPVLFDLSIVVDERVPEADIRSEITKAGKELVSKVDLFDVYRGSQIKTGEKSLAYHIYYQSEERTLTEEEVKVVHDSLVKKLKNKFKVRVRE